MRKLFAALLLIAFASGPLPAADTLDVYFINVGAGDAILIDYGDWEALLDAGPGFISSNSEILATLADHVRDGIIELAILSHPHADHYGGFETVLGQYEVGSFWRSQDTDPDTHGPKYSTLLDALALENLVPIQLEAGEQVTFGQLQWTVLGPEQLIGGPENDNENSLVLLATYGDVHFLFVGDIETNGESELLDIALPDGAVILKVAHHGSDTSTSLAFLNWVQAELAVISTKYEAPPASSVLESLGIPYASTSEHGTIAISADGVTFTSSASHEAPDVRSTATVTAADLLINEVEMNPSGSDSGAEWIEIYNPTAEAISLAGWAASYTGYGGGWDFTPAASVEPGSYYRFVYPKQHLENSRGEIIQLRNAAGEIVDETPLGLTDQENDSRTWQRIPNGANLGSLTDWVFVAGTPGTAN